MRNIPNGYFSEETMQHMIPYNATSSHWLQRSVEAMLACKLTLVYGRYHLMTDLQSLTVRKETGTYEHAEVMADFINQLVPSHPTSPAELMRTQDDYIDDTIDAYKEYKHYLKFFEGECFYPNVAEQFCKIVYGADDYYTFKAFCNLNYSVYAETLLLYQLGRIDYGEFVEQFQEISLFEGKRKPLNSVALKNYIKTMRTIVNLYASLMIDCVQK